MMTWSKTSIFRSWPPQIKSRVTLMSASDVLLARYGVLALINTHSLNLNHRLGSNDSLRAVFLEKSDNFCVHLGFLRHG
jgi:hypothetical protein